MFLQQLASAPQWLFGIDSAFELFSLIVAGMIAFYGYRIYKVSGEVKYSQFSLSFLFLAAALLSKGLLDIYSFSAIKEFGFQAFSQLVDSGKSAFYTTGTDIFRLLWLAGYALLIKALYNIEDLKKSIPLLATVFIGVLGGKYFAFIIPNIVALCLLSVLVKYYYGNHSKKKSLSSSLTLAAFCLIFVSELFFILTIFGATAGFAFYALAHLSRMIGFVILAYNLYLVFRK